LGFIVTKGLFPTGTSKRVTALKKVLFPVFGAPTKPISIATV